MSGYVYRGSKPLNTEPEEERAEETNHERNAAQQYGVLGAVLANA